MRVLLVESTPGNAVAVKEWLESAGHQTATCFEPPVGFGCRGVDHHDACPLEQPTDMALVVRDFDGGARSLTEMGAVCAMRHRIPVVEVTEPESSDLDGTLTDALRSGADAVTGPYVAAVRSALATVTTIASPEAIGVTVNRSAGRVHAMLDLPADVAPGAVPMIVDWTSRALRAHDPYVKVIDVGINRAT